MQANGTIAQMVAQAQKQAQQTNEKILKREIVQRKKMNGDSKYSYCPFCLASGAVSENNKEGALYKVTEKIVFKAPDNVIHMYFEEYWYCNKCSKNLSVADFVKVYARPLGYKDTEL